MSLPRQAAPDPPQATRRPRVAAVPEPAAWMPMLLGFGGIGFALRRRASGATRAFV